MAKRRELGGQGVPTPPILFMTPDGEVVGEVDNYASEARVLQAMLDVLKAHPEYAAPSEAEANLEDPVARAEVAIDLQDPDAARKAIEGAEGDRAAYLRGCVTTDAESMEREFAAVKDASLLDDVRMERARRLWTAKEYERLRDALADFPKDSNRYTESQYLLGLAQFHLKERDAALATWKALATGCGQDRWVYRADWAYCGVTDDRGGAFSSEDESPSLLGRIGYMGRRNPDLKRR